MALNQLQHHRITKIITELKDIRDRISQLENDLALLRQSEAEPADIAGMFGSEAEPVALLKPVKSINGGLLGQTNK